MTLRSDIETRMNEFLATMVGQSLTDELLTSISTGVRTIVYDAVITYRLETCLSADAQQWLADTYVTRCIKMTSVSLSSRDVIGDFTESKRSNVALTLVERSVIRQEFADTVIVKALEEMK